jgi:hyperosmotically inducible protein
MRKHLTAVFAILTAAVLTVGCAQTDAGVTTKVKSKFAMDDTVKAYQIDVDTREHVVTLSGTVDSMAAKDRAAALARETEGVSDVVNNITVGDGNAAMPGEHPTAPTTGVGDAARGMGEATREGASKAGEEIKEGASKVGEEIKEGADKVGDAAKRGADRAEDMAREGASKVGDAGLTAAVKAKMLADDDVRGLAIDVDTSNGVVTLTGNVKSATEKAEAVRIARGTDGVKSVNDNLTIVK